jgi:hypothetical protein
MDVTRLLAGALAVNRIGFGANYLVRPQSAGPTWVGRVAQAPGAQVMIRSQGARDIALGLGALWALGTGGDAHSWMVAHAIADGADTAATWAARKHLPDDGRLALALAAGSTAIAVVSAVGLRRADSPVN